MSKKPNLCFYCGALTRKTGVGDHFPFQKHSGGTHTVPCCVTCHDMKDRHKFAKWPIKWKEKFLQDMSISGITLYMLISQWWSTLDHVSKLGISNLISRLPMVLSSKDDWRNAIDFFERAVSGNLTSEEVVNSNQLFENAID